MINMEIFLKNNKQFIIYLYTIIFYKFYTILLKFLININNNI